MRRGQQLRAAVAAGLTCLLFLGSALAQEGEPRRAVPLPRPVPPLPGARGPVPDPVSPPAQTVTEDRVHVRFRLPPGWNLARRDGEVSTFHLDARTAPHHAEMLVVATLAFNPYPASTFSGALFYVSQTSHSSPASCAAQTTFRPERPLQPMTIADVSFSRGKDEHGHICTEARDVTYTALRRGSCLRFDLAVNTFCGGEDSGAQDMTEAQLGEVFKRMEGILESVEWMP